MGKARKRRGKSSLDCKSLKKRKKQVPKQDSITSRQGRKNGCDECDECEVDSDRSIEDDVGPQSDALLDALARIEGRAAFKKRHLEKDDTEATIPKSLGEVKSKCLKLCKKEDQFINRTAATDVERGSLPNENLLQEENGEEQGRKLYLDPSKKSRSHDINLLLCHKSNAMDGWFEIPIDKDTVAEQSRIDMIKQERKSLGLRVSCMKKLVERVDTPADHLHYLLPFESRFCPPPLPLDVFQKMYNYDDDNRKNDLHEGEKVANATETIILPTLYKHFFAKQRYKKKNAITRPTPIQAQSWPILSCGRCNLLGIAPTGSGKTLAFGLPMIQICMNAIKEHDIYKRSVSSYKKKKAHSKSLKSSYKVEHGPVCLVLSPTRELAHQSGKVLKSVSQSSANSLLEKERQKHISNFSREQYAGNRPTLNVATIYGGNGSEDRREQAKKFAPGEPMIHILSATPGRLMDLIGGISKKDDDNGGEKTGQKKKGGNSGVLRLDNVAYLVIDEADKMLQMGFREQVCAIVDFLRNDRITCLFSATFPQRLAEAADRWFSEKRPTVLVRASMASCGKPDLSGGIVDTHDVESTPRDVHSLNEVGQPRDISSLRLIVGKVIDSERNSDVRDPAELQESGSMKEVGEGYKTDFGSESKSVSKVHTTLEQEMDTDRLSEVSSIPGHIAQVLHVCAVQKKPKKLIGILQKLRQAEKEQGRTRHQGLLVVFFSKIKTLKYVAGLLRQQDLKCRELHGQLRQGDRELALKDFKAGKNTTLLATDVAGRGIHVNNVEYIVNYDFPPSIEQYVHRCGRAARNYDPANAKDPSKPAACVYSFFTRDFAPMAPDMLRLLQASDAWIDPNLSKLVNEKTRGKGEKVASVRTDTLDLSKTKDGDGRISNTTKSTEKESSAASRGNSSRKEKQLCAECDDVEKSDDEFAYLSTSNIVFKRAEHISDGEESADEDFE